ncbi:MAG: NrfD/PsrC family molybdoenzyme membrane anchor subunit [Acidimicrobiales bacterium]
MIVVPKAEPRSYYGQPILKPPVWEPLEIAGYFFLGGLAGGSSILAAVLDSHGEPEAARRLKLGAVGAIALSAAALVRDLGRPARALNMLRVMKPTSPMSVGSWLLFAYGPLAGVAATSAATGRTDRIGRIGRMGRVATGGAAVLGAGVASYTSVLIADTAVPAWHEAYRELPFVFVSSAAAAASGLALLTAPTSALSTATARRLGTLGAATELCASQVMTRRAGILEETFRTGRAGLLLRVAEISTLAGGLGAAVLASRNRAAGRVSGALLMGGSALTRFGLFHAGVQSTADPRYVVGLQRNRIESRSQRDQEGAEEASS